MRKSMHAYNQYWKKNNRQKHDFDTGYFFGKQADPLLHGILKLVFTPLMTNSTVATKNNKIQPACVT